MYTSRKLSATRILSESAREFIERVERDIWELPLVTIDSEFDPSRDYPYWNKLSYKDGNEILSLGSNNGWKIYIFGKRNESWWLDPCTTPDRENPMVYCSIYLKEWDEYYNTLDSFIPFDDKKRVKATSFRVYVSWDERTSNKVTIVLSLALMPRIWVPSSLVGTYRLELQTTLSQRIWKQR